MKTLLAVLAFLLCASGAVQASAVPITPPLGIAATSGGFTTASTFTGQFSAASFSGGFTTNVGGKAVTMPAAMRLAANAPNIAASAVRLNPAGLITSAVAAWLLSQGLQYLNGQFMSNSSSSQTTGTGYWEFDANARGSSISEVCSKVTNRGVYSTCVDTGQRSGPGGKQATIHLTYLPSYCSYCDPVDAIVVYSGDPQCPVNTTWNNGFCVGLSVVPDSDPKWGNLSSAPLPDSVASDLAKTVPLPLQNPEFNPKQVDIPLGEPRIDPVTGKPFQDKARLTPSGDGKSADVQMFEQPLDENGAPAINPDGTQQAPTDKTPEFCELHPDSIGCSGWGEPENVDIHNKDRTFSITPDTGWGADNGSCPADKTYTTRMTGQFISISWQPVCQTAQTFRPVILGMASVLAVVLAIGIARKYS